MIHEESNLQVMCVSWFRLQYRSIANLLFAVPNGGKRNKLEAVIMRKEGVTAGVADLILLKPNKYFSSLCIEMKTAKGKQSPLQKDWQTLAESNGNKYVICRSFDEFRRVVDEYLQS